MTHTYEELHDMTVAQMRDLAQGVEHEAVAGYSTMHKEDLLKALCAAFGIEAHVHHEVVGVDKSAIKARIKGAQTRASQGHRFRRGEGAQADPTPDPPAEENPPQGYRLEIRGAQTRIEILGVLSISRSSHSATASCTRSARAAFHHPESAAEIQRPSGRRSCRRARARRSLRAHLLRSGCFQRSGTHSISVVILA